MADDKPQDPGTPTRRMIGKYPVERQLEQGPLREVWLGRHPELGIPVLIKTISLSKARNDPTAIERLVREAKAAALINHPNLTRVYDAGSDGDVQYLVMEQVEGQSVQQLLDQAQGPLPLAQSISIVTKIAEALEAAAQYHLVHRNIKPENILLDRAGVPKLTDLGLAKASEGTPSFDVTMPGVPIGTPAYVSPEQAKGTGIYDSRSDIYSLGITFFHLVTGKLPFTGSALDVMFKHMFELVPNVRTVNPAVPEAVAAVIVRMTAKNPSDRYATPTDLVKALSGLDVSAAAVAEQKAVATAGDGTLQIPPATSPPPAVALAETMPQPPPLPPLTETPVVAPDQPVAAPPPLGETLPAVVGTPTPAEKKPAAAKPALDREVPRTSSERRAGARPATAATSPGAGKKAVGASSAKSPWDAGQPAAGGEGTPASGSFDFAVHFENNKWWYLLGCGCLVMLAIGVVVVALVALMLMRVA